jgi:putative membrane protein
MAPLALARSLHVGEFVPPLAALGAYAWAYELRRRALPAHGHAVLTRWRHVAFYGGLFLVLVSISPPFDAVADHLLWGHMLQHMLLGDFAPLLVALGLTGPMLQPILRRRPGDVLRWTTHPLGAFLLWAVDLYVWHTPPLYQAALRSDIVHSLEHACFFLFGLNMWIALIGPLPKPRWFGNLGRLGFVVGVRFAGAVLANVLIWSDTIFYPYYAGGERTNGVSALADQGAAGSIMMLVESVMTLGLFCWLFMRAASEGERKQELIEFAAEHDIDLTPERAARAVAAGRDADLRERYTR